MTAVNEAMNNKIVIKRLHQPDCSHHNLVCMNVATMAEEQIEGLKDDEEQRKAQDATNYSSSSSSSMQSSSTGQQQSQRQQPTRRLSGPIMSPIRRKSNGSSSSRVSKRSSPIRSIFNAVVKYLYNDAAFQDPLSADQSCQLYALYKQATGRYYIESLISTILNNFLGNARGSLYY